MHSVEAVAAGAAERLQKRIRVGEGAVLFQDPVESAHALWRGIPKCQVQSGNHFIRNLAFLSTSCMVTHDTIQCAGGPAQASARRLGRLVRKRLAALGEPRSGRLEV
jgi:hypothetical protein